MNKSCSSCKKSKDCDIDTMRACRVWGGLYKSEVVDLRLWESKYDKGDKSMDYKSKWYELQNWIIRGDLDCAILAEENKLSGNELEFIRLESKHNTLHMVAEKMHELEN